MTSQHDIVVASVDGRGSGRRGKKLEWATYTNIGQFEKEDASDFAEFLIKKGLVQIFTVVEGASIAFVAESEIIG